MTPETSIYEYARQGLALSANKTALWFYGRSMTYRELFNRIDNVADHLYVLGIRQGTVVTIHLPNCPQAVMAIYAVAKLGGICNMVHPAMPLNALKEKMHFTESRFLITGNFFRDSAQVDFAERVIYVDVGAHMGTVKGFGYRLKAKGRLPAGAVPFEMLEKKASKNAVLPKAETLASKCVFYLHSSGTTGDPKTVMHCHSALNREALNIRIGCSLGDVNEDVLLNIMPLYHGLGLMVDLHSATSGGTKIVQMATWSPQYAVQLIQKHQVTIMTAVPKIYYDLLQQKNFNGGSFRYCFSGGDVFNLQKKEEFLKKTGHPIFEGYGLTEVVASCAVEVHDGVNLGFKPFPWSSFAVRSLDGSISKIGEGELFVNSCAAMMGYLKDSAADGIWMEWNGKRWLRTGDYGFLDALGNFHFIERVKYTIIRNGNNVFPKEVEDVILKSGCAREACVIGRWDEQQHTQSICAYVVLEDKRAGDAESEIKAHCEANLPGYAVPQIICFLEALPRNAVGKIDRKRLEKQGQ